MLQHFTQNASDEAVEFVEEFYFDFLRDADFEKGDNRFAYIMPSQSTGPDLGKVTRTL